jgi:coenzyme Q-binding protein COQ10
VTSHRSSRIIPVDREALFALVADVERYPQFLPMWRRARVYARDTDAYWTEQEVGFGPIRERFRTRTALSPPERIDVSSNDGLFRAFRILWTFADAPNGTRIDILLQWETRSRLLQGAVDRALPTTTRTMVQAFEDEALRRSLRLPSLPRR